MNRPELSDPPGELGTIAYEYGVNDSDDDVLFHFNFSLVHYPIGTLRKSTTIDQNGHKSIVFTDKFGRKVLSRREEGDFPYTRHDTYYLYNVKHQLTTVLPPGSNLSLTPDLIYSYEYFGNGKISSKKIPGAEEVLYLYNSRELLAATQDGNMRAENPNKWLAHEYDDQGRLVKTGFIYVTLQNENFYNPVITEVLSTHTFYPNTQSSTDNAHLPLNDEYRILGTSDFLYTNYF